MHLTGLPGTVRAKQTLPANPDPPRHPADRAGADLGLSQDDVDLMLGKTGERLFNLPPMPAV